MLDVSVKMDIIDFLQSRIKQKLQENAIITPKKGVILIGIDLVQSSLPFMKMILGACFGLGQSPFALDIAIKTMIRGSV